MTGAKSGTKARELRDQMEANGIDFGMLHGPTNHTTPWLDIYALDNDCFTHSHEEGWWEAEGEKQWVKLLDKVCNSPRKPLFAVLPDKVGDWPKTVEKAWFYLPYLRERGIPVAIALQDGAHLEAAVMLSPDWFFVGGSVKWKWANAERITEFGNAYGIKTHVGRVNGERQLRQCLRMGVHSCDGTGLARFTDEMLPRTVAAFKPLTQMKLEI